MKIDKNRPLPAHTKLKYEECLAKIVLEKLFPNRYTTLEIADKPDLRDLRHNIGIEVTSSDPVEEREALRLWSTTNYMDESENKERNIKRLEQLGVKYTEGVQVWPSKSFWPSHLESTPWFYFFNAFCEKARKLNQGHYAVLSEYDLFVHSEDFFWPYELSPWMSDLLEKMVEKNQKVRRFSYVYLVGGSSIYIWNLVRQNYEVMQKDKDFWRYGWEAREMGIQKEESGE